MSPPKKLERPRRLPLRAVLLASFVAFLCHGIVAGGGSDDGGFILPGGVSHEGGGNSGENASGGNGGGGSAGGGGGGSGGSGTSSGSGGGNSATNQSALRPLGVLGSAQESAAAPSQGRLVASRLGSQTSDWTSVETGADADVVADGGTRIEATDGGVRLPPK